MKKILILLITLYISLQAKMLYNFSDISVNYFDWSGSTETNTPQEDFGYLNLEGAVGWDWGELYAYASLENPTKKYSDDFPNDLRYTALVDFDIDIMNGFRVHFQDFHLHSQGFFVNDAVVGLGYKHMFKSGFWIRPFVGVHYTKDTYYDGLNGYMAGWKFNYNFVMFEEKFNVFNWSEIEFGRAKDFYENAGVPIGDSKSYGLNGDMNLWWNLDNSLSTGVHYRYAKYKLGFSAYQSAFIYSLKYNF